uniref:BSD domain-containing protein n=1 Tax=Kalanchoe fedtschenkoi TaxID=63787 RepID=A0A7N0V053_KALFE
MSWFGSIVNSLRLDDDDENDAVAKSDEQERLHVADDDDIDDDDSSLQSDDGQHGGGGGGVKEDLSEITKTLTRQLWGVASFLAPPPPQSPTKAASSGEVDDREGSESAAGAGIDGIRSDFAEISGRFKSGITKLSGGAKAVSELSKMASSFLQLGLDQGGGSVGEHDKSDGSTVGVTEEVVAFAKNVAMHPETWLDFPLADDDEEQDDFDMSDAQQEHALAVERLVPELAALRFELCPEYMSDDLFWKIYFVLVHPRLAKHDADVISTPQILETRAMLTQELKNQRETAVESEILEGDASFRKEEGASSPETSLSITSNTQPETLPSHLSTSEPAPTSASARPTESYADSIKDVQVANKSVVLEEAPKTVPQTQKSRPDVPSTSYADEDDGDYWLKEETTEAGTGSGIGIINIPITNDEDVSFSDLEEDEDDDAGVPTGTKATYGSDSSTKSRDWVQLSRSSSDSAKENKLPDGKHNGSPNKEANDWLNIEDIDEM